MPADMSARYNTAMCANQHELYLLYITATDGLYSIHLGHYQMQI